MMGTTEYPQQIAVSSTYFSVFFATTLPCTGCRRKDEGSSAGEICDLVRLRTGGDAEPYQISASDYT